INLNPDLHSPSATVCCELGSGGSIYQIGSLRIWRAQSLSLSLSPSQDETPPSRIDAGSSPGLRKPNLVAPARPPGSRNSVAIDLPELQRQPGTRTQGPSPESITSRVTDRLVSIDSTRFSKRRILQMAVYVAVFMCSAALLAALAMRLAILVGN
ncbi:MAG: hypothetical protein WBD31_05465, partial [Rubripirellula sp.]